MAVDKSKEKEVKELPNNPLHCWSTLGLYTTLALSSALVVISLIIQILTKTTVADPTPVLSFFNIVQTAATGISLAGYFVFLVYPFLNLVKLIFEDISDKESFATNLKFILRSQWFLLLFHLTLVSPLIFAGLNYLSITLIAFNLMLDLYNADLNFKKQGDKTLEYLSYALCLLTTVVTGNWVTGIAFVVIKLFSSYILKRTQRFLDYVVDPKIAKKMYLLYILSMINAYMFCFVLLRNYSNFVDVNSEIMLSGSLGRILGNVFTPNITKMVTWFM